MAISTIGSHFMYKASSTAEWTELFKFKTSPDLQSAPEVLDTTTQADHARTSVLGLEGNDAKTFTLNYDAAVYDTIKGLEGTAYDVAEWLGDTYDSTNKVYTPTGSYGKFEGKAYMTVTKNGGEVNAVHDMTVTLAMVVPFVKVPTTSA